MAAVAMGAAAGARLTHSLFLLPLIVRAIRSDRPVVNTLKLATAGGLSLVAVYTPLLDDRGLGFLRFDAPVRRDYITGAYRLYEGAIGAPLVAALAATIGSWVARDSCRTTMRRWAREPVTVICLASAALAILPWLLLPTDPSYVIGALPFLCLAVATLPWQSLTAVIAVAAVIPSFVGVLLLDVDAWRRDHAVVLTPIARGAVARDRAVRREVLARGAHLRRSALPRGSCIVAGASIWPFQRERGIPPRQF